MNPELEALMKALDAYLESSGKEAGRLRQIYESQLEDAASKHPGLSELSLHKAVESAYRRWRRNQNQPPSLPPKA
jgi:hypothetical protein